MKFLTRLLPFAAFAPALALAQGELGEVSDFLTNIVQFINDILVPLIFAIAFLVFIWGVFNYFIFGAGDEGKRETGKSYMLYGIIGFVVMVSVWGIVNLLAGGFGLDEEELQTIPNTPVGNP
jgi:hypothetical protein